MIFKENSMRQITLVVILFLLVVAFRGVSKDKETEREATFQVGKISRALQLTGKLDDSLWQSVPSIFLDYEVTPGDNTPAPQRTQARALFDQENLYFGIRCYDSHPDQIRSNLSDRDKMYQDDYIIVIVDTYGDYQRAYEFAVNPMGIQGDLMRTSSSEDESFDLIWHSAAARNDSGWTAELAIPFKSLRFASTENQKWRVHVIRNYPRASRVQTSWMPIDKNNPNFMGQAGTLDGLKDITPGSSVELLPYVMGQQSGNLNDYDNPSSGFHNNAVIGRVGGGILYSPSPDVTIDAVVNPDFSQVESDASQISVNTTFALYYSEKRPFFLTGQELLQTPMYYSRSINNPLWAARVMGKSGSLSYLVLSAYDRNTPFDIPGEERSNTFSSDRKSSSNIGRLRYDFGDEIYVGGMLFTRNFSNAHNYVAGFDWKYKFWNNWYFSGETFLSNTREMSDSSLFASDRTLGSTGHTAGFDGEQFSGTGFHAVLSRSAKEYSFTIVYNNFSPTYQTYTGSFSNTDYQQLYIDQYYTIYPKESFIDRGGIELETYGQFNHNQIKKEQVIQPTLFVTTKGQTSVYLTYLIVNDERFRNIWFQGIHRGIFTITSRPVDAISLSLSGQVGKFIYRSSSPVMGEGHRFSSTLSLKPTSMLNISIGYERARLSTFSEGELLFDGNIYRSTITYQFNPEFFIRLIDEYDTFGKVFNIYPLFSYKLNAFTTFYAGATNNFHQFNEDGGFTSTDRQYFMKLQYLFRN